MLQVYEAIPGNADIFPVTPLSRFHGLSEAPQKAFCLCIPESLLLSALKEQSPARH